MNLIESYHDIVRRNPDRYCQAQKDLVKYIEGLLKKRIVYYDEDEALIWINFIETFMTLTQGTKGGQPLELIPWERHGIACVFGIKEKATRLRYFNLWFLLIAKKNGKTEVSAAVALAILFLESGMELGSEIYIMSGTEDQAKKCYETCMNMLRASVDLLDTVGEKNVNWQRIFYPATNSFIKLLTGTALTKDGKNPAFYILDELHVIKNRESLDILKRGQGAREQGLGMITTTAPSESNDFYEEIYNEAKDILSGKNKVSRMFPQIFEADDMDPWDSDEAIFKANPSIGVSQPLRNLQQMRDEAREKVEDFPYYCAKQINRPMNTATSYLTRDILVKNAIEINTQDIYDTYAIFSIDMSSTTDLTCATALIPRPDRSFLFLQKYFMADKRMEYNIKNDKKDYLKFTDTERFGGNKTDIVHKQLLHICDGSDVNVDDIVNWMNELQEEHQILFQAIGYDSYRSKELKKAFVAAGFERLLYDVKYQAAYLNNAVRLSKALLQDGKLKYSRYNSLFLWCAENTMVITTKADALMPDKKKSRGRIDGYSSLVMALVCYEEISDFFEEFVYESR